MKFQRTPTTLNAQLEGLLGETTTLFTMPMAGLKEITLDLNKVTSINSIGIKHWILWTVKIPQDCVVHMINCPFIIGSQASMVVGFTKPNMKIESIRLPYICSGCDTEHMREAKLGVDYQYATPTAERVLSLPEKTKCPKCGKEDTAEPDFILEKTFKFLELPRV
jgi:predicted Zn-ribbon and HTH transcriptional regulator